MELLDVVSTHDQLLGGDDGQIFIGAIFPLLMKHIMTAFATEARKIAEALKEKGALGRFAIDFLSVKEDGWKMEALCY